MESNITEFIDIEKFQEKLEELEKKENKKVYEAFLNLAKAQTGDYLLNDKNVSRINTVTALVYHKGQECFNQTMLL